MLTLARPVVACAEPRIEGVLRIKNFYWTGPVFRPTIEPRSRRGWLAMLGAARGRFALILDEGVAGRIILVRDLLGANKLFFAIHRSGRVTVANYLWDLVKCGVPCEAVYSVPPGCALRIDALRATLDLWRHSTIAEPYAPRPLRDVANGIRAQLEAWFARLADQFRYRPTFVCLSGGLDSGVIAAFARRYFPNLTAYTYSYTENGGAETEDAVAARRLADALGIPLRIVPASAADVLAVLGSVLVNGQDWRDFNVHCAVVNELLARAMKADLADTTDRSAALVLTGDLNNEFFADYTTVVYRGREYYSLPKMDRGSLRKVLIRGLDAGDREVGVFAAHGLDVIQPYGLIADALMQIPVPLLNDPDTKVTVARQIAGDMLPDWIFTRPKVRAQIGNARCESGILPTLADSGRDSRWLRQTFRNTFGITDDGFFSRFIRAGSYRSLHAFPARLCKSDYLIG